MNPLITAIFGNTNPEHPKDGVQKLGAVIGLKPEFEIYYRELHANVWPEVLQRIERCNIRNYSIFITEIMQRKYLFSYCEYVGEDFDVDMAMIAEYSEVKKWWKETEKCQIKMLNTPPNEHWSKMENVFFKR